MTSSSAPAGSIRGFDSSSLATLPHGILASRIVSTATRILATFMSDAGLASVGCSTERIAGMRVDGWPLRVAISRWKSAGRGSIDDINPCLTNHEPHGVSWGRTHLLKVVRLQRRVPTMSHKGWGRSSSQRLRGSVCRPGSTTRYSRDRSTRQKASCFSSSPPSARPQSGSVPRCHSNSQADDGGALVLRNVGALGRHEQAALSRWLDASRTASGRDDRGPAVSVGRARGLFDEALYYRLNTMLMRIDSTGAAA